MHGTDVVICEPLRTPVGRIGGALAQLSATELAVVTLSELVRRTGLGEGDVDDVILGNGYANGERRRSVGSPRSTPASAPACPACRSTAAAAPACRLCCTPPRRSPPARLGWSSPAGAESMSNVEHYALGLRSGVRQGGMQLMDRLDRARETAGGAVTPGARRDDRDGREPP